jgi:hypothetical protein
MFRARFHFFCFCFSSQVYTWLTHHGNDVPHVTNMRVRPGAAPYTGPCIPFETTEEQWYGQSEQTNQRTQKRGHVG